MRRKLQIAFSTMCAVACLLLVALWIRSYWWSDTISIPISEAQRFGISSTEGNLLFQFHKNRSRMRVFSSINLAEIEPLLSQRGSLGRPLVTKSPPTIGFRNGKFGCPHWLFVIVGILLAVTFGIGPTFRFSVRTLLIATAFLALLLGAIVYAVR